MHSVLLLGSSLAYIYSNINFNLRGVSFLLFFRVNAEGENPPFRQVKLSNRGNIYKNKREESDWNT